MNMNVSVGLDKGQSWKGKSGRRGSSLDPRLSLIGLPALLLDKMVARD